MLNCLIIDPEPGVLDLLEKYIGRTPFLQLIKRAQSVSEALEYVKTVGREASEGVDIIFWGLEVSKTNDVDLSHILSEWGRGRMKVIFTRELDESAPYKFQSDILGQLLHPINYNKFLKIVMTAHDWFIQTKNDVHTSRFEKRHTQQRPDSIWIKEGYRPLNILFTDILCIEKIKDCVRIRLTNGNQVITQMTLKALAEQLPKEVFVQVHRSYIVRLSEINVIEHGHIIFGQMQIPISNSFRNVFMQMLAQRTFDLYKTESEVYNSKTALLGVDIPIASPKVSLPD